MYELPDELWNLIKNYLLDYKKYHQFKMKPILQKYINNRFIEKYERWTIFPPWKNTNEIIRDEYQTNQLSVWVPESDLPLTSICFNVKPGSGGWWCGYGWTQNIKN